MKKLLPFFAPFLCFALCFNFQANACDSFNFTYTFTSATPGQTVTVTWTSTGCAPGSLIDISLIDVSANAIAQYYPGTANSGSFDVVLGSGLTPGPYQFYVQYAPSWPPEAWGYGDEFIIDVPTPVELMDFSGKVINRTDVELNWQTASEIENKGFEVEYSTNGKDWTMINFVEGAGESVQIQDYRFVHESPENENNYYRLKQIDFGATYSYSPILTIQLQKNSFTDLTIFPNPSTDVIRISNSNLKSFEYSIVNTLGEISSSGISDSNEIVVSHLPTGAYRLLLFSEERLIYQNLFLKQ